jgi:hypothetical protein
MWIKGYLAGNKNEGWSIPAPPAFSDLFYRLLTFVLHIELEVFGIHRYTTPSWNGRTLGARHVQQQSGFRSDPFLSPRCVSPSDVETIQSTPCPRVRKTSAVVAQHPTTSRQIV